MIRHLDCAGCQVERAGEKFSLLVLEAAKRDSLRDAWRRLANEIGSTPQRGRWATETMEWNPVSCGKTPWTPAWPSLAHYDPLGWR